MPTVQIVHMDSGMFPPVGRFGRSTSSVLNAISKFCSAAWIDEPTRQVRMNRGLERKR